MRHTSARAGFTLVELAIVLVIIGLIVGGVLVGQDLIKAATIRSTITDIEKYNAAATAFRGKYDGLPGDLLASKAVAFGFSGSGDANATGAGAGLRDGNGVLQDGSGTALNLTGEAALFWKDLGAARFIPGSYAGYGTAIAPAAAITAANRNTYIPKTKLRDSACIHAYSANGRNFFFMAAITTDAAGVITTANAVTPLEARGIDEKLDDGLPTTGIVESYTDLATADAGTTLTSSTCMDGTATIKTYNSVDANSGNINCQLQIRSSF